MTREEFIEVMDSTIKRVKELGSNVFKETLKVDGVVERISYVFPVSGDEGYFFVKDTDRVYFFHKKFSFTFNLSEVASMSRGVSSIAFFDKDYNLIAKIIWD